MKRDDLTFSIIDRERNRQTSGLELIASENFVSEQVPGALTQGKTHKEVISNLKEAIILVLEAERGLGITRHEDEEIIRRELVTV